jgi:HEAT repeat protein
MTPADRKRLIRELNGRTRHIAIEAAKTICLDREWPPSLAAPVIRTLTHGRRALNRAAAAYVLETVTSNKAIIALERKVSDKSEHPSVRGAAAESLAHTHRRESHKVLLSGLNDPSKEVRFWCTFSLGEMGEERAIPLLEKLAATDKRIVRGFHSVAQEAEDSIKNIRGDSKQHRRKGGCIFCIKK